METSFWGSEKAVRDLVEPLVKDAFLELFDFTFRRQGNKTLLTVVLDKKEGDVSLEECERLSRVLSERLDALDPIAGPYLLEVSSPGLDRPLRGPMDCGRFAGRLALFIVTVPVDGNSSLRGRLLGAEGDEAVLRLEGGKEVRVPFSTVKSARLVVEF